MVRFWPRGRKEEGEEVYSESRLRSRLEVGVEVGWDMGVVGDGGGSWPGCCTPMTQIGSPHLSGWASLSRINRIALSRWPLLCLAAVRSAFGCFVLGEPARTWEAERVDWERRFGRDRSVDEPEKV